jgi:hypothetical protein
VRTDRCHRFGHAGIGLRRRLFAHERRGAGGLVLQQLVGRGQLIVFRQFIRRKHILLEQLIFGRFILRRFFVRQQLGERLRDHGRCEPRRSGQ